MPWPGFPPFLSLPILFRVGGPSNLWRTREFPLSDHNGYTQPPGTENRKRSTKVVGLTAYLYARQQQQQQQQHHHHHHHQACYADTCMHTCTHNQQRSAQSAQHHLTIEACNDSHSQQDKVRGSWSLHCVGSSSFNTNPPGDATFLVPVGVGSSDGPRTKSAMHNAAHAYPS
ncbi:hypothetical protein LY78DRAFT_429719 [Colletotrichum sublineola]|nr:hypothetical protein LY78DRAFT_429719 [Colletotrichum sublineola]